ncbi:hypothetical protein ACFVYD_34540 [Streptomyces sp. NPDC058301]|uniref:hypothetical protein n=1 Tax=Streptomyces sp. NPDC058301 TaxID=3346436 RepID=UPI0036E390F0
MLTAKSVYVEFWKEYNRVSKHLRCGKVPALERVAYGQNTGHRCQYASSVDGKARWGNVPVSVGERGVIFDNGRSLKSPSTLGDQFRGPDMLRPVRSGRAGPACAGRATAPYPLPRRTPRRWPCARSLAPGSVTGTPALLVFPVSFSPQRLSLT